MEKDHPFYPHYKGMCDYIDRMRPDIASLDSSEKSAAICEFLAENEDPVEIMQRVENTTGNKYDGMPTNFLEKMESVQGKETEISSLPVEDTVWFIQLMDTFGPDKEGESLRIFSVTDRKGLFIAVCSADPEELTFQEQAYKAICQAALYPLAKKARRAKCATYKDPILAQQMPLDLSKLGIQFLYHGGPAITDTEDPAITDTEDRVRMRECACCRFRGSKELFKRCSSCRAMLYCSQNCQKQDWSKSGEMALHSHKKWCAKIKTYMKKEQQLKVLPFTFSKETTSPDFDIWHLHRFLVKHGVYNQGMWRRECTDWIQPGQSVQFGNLQDDGNGIVLPVEMTILEEIPPLPTSPIVDWDCYFKHRGLKLHSPIAILLQYPLTLYYILQFYDSWWESVDENELAIDIIGVEKEVEMLQLFKETGSLMPEKTLDIHMFGREISKTVDGLEENYGNVKIIVHKKLYHNVKDIRKPHVAVGFNAGLGAYLSWADTLKELKKKKIPAFFTDYCQYSCEYGNIAMQQLGLGTTSTPVINPFRSPVRKESEQNDMPWYSNGFLYYLRYDNWT